MFQVARILLFTVVLGAPASEARAAEGPPLSKPAAGLSRFDFLVGSWRGELDGAVIEEHWSARVGNSIAGMSRVTAGGAVRMYELCAIEQSQDGVVLWMRHFGGALAGGDPAPQRWTLASMNRREAVFERPEGGERLTYRGVNRFRLEITLRKDGKDVVFRYARVR